jgi:hypothetical protein
MHDLALNHVTKRHVRGMHAYEDTPAGKIHALFYFLACPSAQYASTNPEWVRCRALQWVRTQLLPRITTATGKERDSSNESRDLHHSMAPPARPNSSRASPGTANNKAKTLETASQHPDDALLGARFRCLADMVPPGNEAFRVGDSAHMAGGLRLLNDVQELDEAGWMPLVEGVVPKRINKDNTRSGSFLQRRDRQDVSMRRGSMCSVGNDLDDAQFTSLKQDSFMESPSPDRDDEEQPEALRWWCLLVHDKRDAAQHAPRQIYQAVAWRFHFRFYAVDVCSNPDMGTLLSVEATPCVRLYSSDGRYREYFGDASDMSQLSAFIETHEECLVEEHPAIDWLPLSRFLEIPDGVQEYLDACLALSLQADRDGGRLVRPVEGVLGQLMGYRLELANRDVSGPQVHLMCHVFY